MKLSDTYLRLRHRNEYIHLFQTVSWRRRMCKWHSNICLLIYFIYVNDKSAIFDKLRLRHGNEYIHLFQTVSWRRHMCKWHSNICLLIYFIYVNDKSTIFDKFFINRNDIGICHNAGIFIILNLHVPRLIWTRNKINIQFQWFLPLSLYIAT